MRISESQLRRLIREAILAEKSAVFNEKNPVYPTYDASGKLLDAIDGLISYCEKNHVGADQVDELHDLKTAASAIGKKVGFLAATFRH